MRHWRWLDDQVVYFYMATLNDRDTRDWAVSVLGHEGMKRWFLPKNLWYDDMTSTPDATWSFSR